MSSAQPEWCMNACDLAGTFGSTSDVEQAALFVLAQANCNAIQRVCVGSYFCDQLFLSLPDAHFEALAAFCSANGVAATLVLPIFAQRTWAAGTQRTDELLTRHAGLFDEVTVNDHATATRLAPLCRERGMAMNWGRLLSKPLRDPRHADLVAAWRTCELDAEEVAALRERFPLGLVEFDPFAPSIDFSPLEGVPFALHAPRSFATTGHICEAASAARATGESFRPGAPCGQECRSSFSLCHDAPSGSYYVKHGRTVYFENPNCQAIGAQPCRIIYSAADYRSQAGEQQEEWQWA